MTFRPHSNANSASEFRNEVIQLITVRRGHLRILYGGMSYKDREDELISMIKQLETIQFD
jgi:hypothetical protein